MKFNRAAARMTAALLLVSSLITPALALTGTVTTAGSSLRVRAEANTAGTVLGKLANGTQVEVLAALEDGWYQIAYAETSGYVSGKYLTVAEQAPAAAPQEQPSGAAAPVALAAELPAEDADQAAEEKSYVRVVAGPLNVRSGPGTDFDKTGRLSTGRVVEVLEQTDGWYKTELGYISAEYVTEADAAQAQASGQGQEIVDYALQFVGCRYVYGGSSPSGFDCSGFTSYVYKHFGYSLNRSASNQLDNGVAVSMDELQPGDLVMFRKSGSSKRASHVGLYIGDGQFVHASTTRVGVIVSGLHEAYYTSGFVGARRII